MEDLSFVGPLIRLNRLKKNWSQETLCSGICAVSYLSKIEQGKAVPNEALLMDLTKRLGFTWVNDGKDQALCEQLYDGIFSWDHSAINSYAQELECWLEGVVLGPSYLDLIVIKAYISGDAGLIPPEMVPALTARQRCLYAILQNDHELAFRCYPCALSAYCVAEEAYCKGNYTYALEYLNTAYEKAAQEGYVYLMKVCQSYMANCYSDIGNMAAMQRHSLIARRMARMLGDQELLNTVDYNLAATELEHGNAKIAYAYFSALEEHSVLSLHKLSICCESIGKPEEALAVLDKALAAEDVDPLEMEMCDVVRYRLTHEDYLHDMVYGERLISLFNKIRKARHHGYARFHLPWVLAWLKANRKYKEAYELMQDFTK